MKLILFVHKENKNNYFIQLFVLFQVSQVDIHDSTTVHTVENKQLADDLNEFYCRFEKTPHTLSEHLSSQPLTPPATTLSPTPALQISKDDVLQVLRKRKKAPGPDCVTPACLKSCADQLAPIFTQITGTVRSPYMLQTLHHHPNPKETQNYRTKWLQACGSNICGHEVI